MNPTPGAPEPGEHKHVGLSTIAGAAGVSKATASRALRHPDTVSPGSLAKVRRALAILGVDSGSRDTPARQMVALIRPATPAG
ncbi:MAG: helix-turn-helix domain-containing protein, partial [Brevibacterium sp.]|nr:helix-turn-helix domain-containing protein [Brevibacterium sp.]